MSLVQQGAQTARNKKLKITGNVIQLIVPPDAITIWNKDAQVLRSTCPKWGNLVVGFQ